MSTPNGDSPAFPFACQGPTTGPEFYYGLTKREEMAKAAMVGFLASPQEMYVDGKRVERNPRLMAHAAVEMADALLAELEKKP